MEVYADNLTAALNDLAQTDFSFNSYRPHIGSLLGHLPEKANLKMRAARYISYPNQVIKAQGDINHILDHGYAHLLGSVQSNSRSSSLSSKVEIIYQPNSLILLVSAAL